MTENLKDIVIDDAYRIADQLALSIVYQLMREEGIFVGLSSGINVAGALRLARALVVPPGPRYVIARFCAHVTVLAIVKRGVMITWTRGVAAERALQIATWI